MIKQLGAAALFFLSGSLFAMVCPSSTSTDNPNFCSSFKTAAICHCTTSGLPAGMCQDMNALYNRMMSVFGSLEQACTYQKHTSRQVCIDSWNCYRRGGVDSSGRACSGSRRACQ
ncbi:MAG: hypothetical protein CK426_06455 [Legionella sp.]|nr:MAG: hypothetical protein CK423_05950 [Legionella sp.]PJD98419.1 MAG: hypothetical protein CK426_06455 [Legionella sp.]